MPKEKPDTASASASTMIHISVPPHRKQEIEAAAKYRDMTVNAYLCYCHEQAMRALCVARALEIAGKSD